MTRFASIVGQEIRLAARDRIPPFMLIGFALLAFYAAGSGAQWRETRAATVAAVAGEVDEIMEIKREQFAAAPADAPPFAAMPQVTPFRPVLPPGSQGALSVGQAEAYPYAARMQPLSNETLFDAFRVHVDNPAVKAAGRFDLALVITLLMPLLLLAATYDLWARDRERGVGLLALSQSIPAPILIAARAIAHIVLVLGPMALICGAALASVAGLQPLALAATVLTVFLYGLFWIALALVVNVVVRRTTEAAIVCGVLWLVVVALGPGLALAAVDLARPAPSAITRANALRALHLEHRAEIQARAPLVEADPAPRIPDRLRVFAADVAQLDARKAPVLDRHDAALEQRREMMDGLRWILPSVAVQDALDRIAGSDADRALAFQDQVFAFRGELRAWLAQRFDADAPMTLEDYRHVPVFRFQEPDIRPGVILDWGLMGAFALGLSALAFRTAARRPLQD